MQLGARVRRVIDTRGRWRSELKRGKRKARYAAKGNKVGACNVGPKGRVLDRWPKGKRKRPGALRSSGSKGNNVGPERLA